MRTRTTFALAASTLAFGVPPAAATPDSYQPQLGAQPDAFERYVMNNAPEEQPDAFSRYLRNQQSASLGSTGAATHPDSRAVRPSPALAAAAAVDGDSRDWAAGALGALGGALVAVVAVAGASAIRGRRRLVLR